MGQASAAILSALGLDWQPFREAVGRLALEITESAILGCLEPEPISSCYDDELPRVYRAILRARDGKLARLGHKVNRNSFLVACGEYADGRPEEHLIIGYGSRHGSTTKVAGIHHIVGATNSVLLPDAVAHSMWDFYGQHDRNELLIFHNHPYNVINFLFDNPPLASRRDRLFLEARALNPAQLARRVLNEGRMIFYLGENGFVKEFRLPSIVALLDRSAAIRQQ